MLEESITPDEDGADDAEVTDDSTEDVEDDASSEAAEATGEEGEEASEEEESEPEGPILPGSDEYEAFSSKQVGAKVNGKDVTRTVAEWVQLAQKGEGADAKFEEAAKVRKENESWREEVKGWFSELADADTFIPALNKAGKPYIRAFEAAAQHLLQEQLDEENLSDEGKANKQLQRRLDLLEKQLQSKEKDGERAEEERKAAEEQSRKEAAEQYSQSIEEQLTKAGFKEDSEEFEDALSLMWSRVNRESKKNGHIPTKTELKEFAAGYAKRFLAPPKPAKKATPPAPIKSGGASKKPAAKRKKKTTKTVGEWFDELESEVGSPDQYWD